MIWHPFQLAVWTSDPLPMGAQAYARWSAGWWRLVSLETLRARR